MKAKRFVITLDTVIHKRIKHEAIEKGITLHQHILDCLGLPETIRAMQTEIDDLEETLDLALKMLADANEYARQNNPESSPTAEAQATPTDSRERADDPGSYPEIAS
jgi:hypothetical protein